MSGDPNPIQNYNFLFKQPNSLIFYSGYYFHLQAVFFRGTSARRLNFLDCAVGIETQAVNADLSVNSGVICEEMSVYTVIYNPPFIRTGYIYYGAMPRTINLLLRILDKNDTVFSDIHRSQGRIRCAVCNMIVGGTCVINRPKEIVHTIPIKDIRRLTICIIT